MGVVGSDRRPVGVVGRGVALVLALGCLGVLAVGSSMAPSAAGHGTHQQLGLPPCGWVVAYGKPCMTCGMTTAVCATTHLRFAEALRAQPAGLALALGMGTAFWIGAYVAATGSRLGHRAAALLSRRGTLAGIVVLAVGSWGYKWATWPEPDDAPRGEVAGEAQPEIPAQDR